MLLSPFISSNYDIFAVLVLSSFVDCPQTRFGRIADAMLDSVSVTTTLSGLIAIGRMVGVLPILH